MNEILNFWLKLANWSPKMSKRCINSSSSGDAAIFILNGVCPNHCTIWVMKTSTEETKWVSLLRPTQLDFFELDHNEHVVSDNAWDFMTLSYCGAKFDTHCVHLFATGNWCTVCKDLRVILVVPYKVYANINGTLTLVMHIIISDLEINFSIFSKLNTLHHLGKIWTKLMILPFWTINLSC